jgi:hypothetical protein
LAILVVTVGNGVDDMNPKPEEGDSAPSSSATPSAATGDGISMFDAVVVVVVAAVCSSGGVVVIGVCMKLKLDAADAGATAGSLSSLEGEPDRKEKALEGAAAAGAGTGTGAAAS